jgi:AcrR family transcriptional regulator
MTSADRRGGGALEEVRAGVVERLRGRRAEIEEVIFARVRDPAPAAVRFADPEYVARLRAAITAAVDFVLTGIERAGESSSPQIPSAAVAQARCAARGRVGLDTVLCPYLDGYALLEDFVIQQADHGDFAGQTAALRRVLGISASLLDRLITSITSAYMQEAERVAAGKRARVIEAMVEVVSERGFAGTSVRHVVARAKVSTGTFYALFDGLEDCFAAVLDIGLERPVVLITQAFASEERWQDGMRAALAALLVYFDSEPLLTKMWFKDMMSAGPRVLERRQRHMAIVSSMIVAHSASSATERPDPVRVMGVMAAVLGVIQTHLVTNESKPLIELLGPLMGLITTHYLDTSGAARETERGAQLARLIQTGDSPWALAQPTRQNTRQGAALPAMLGSPSARRARECLRFLADHPDSSNREVAEGIGVTHQSQISRLLSYLLGEELVVKRSEGAGKRNAWRLTPRGEEIARALPRRYQPQSGVG